ncbi:hypothetical protein FHG87_013372 [Trinorchestia longiramus]|nr:hypothetical protein FHG87_013372 [Trinorchestia longiramus]
MHYDIPFDKTIQNVITLLQAHTSACVDTEKPRDFLVLPCKRKLQYITSSIDKDQVLRETFDKVQTLQLKNAFLLVDEVQIEPTVQFSGGVLRGMAENNRNCRATSMLLENGRMKPITKHFTELMLLLAVVPSVHGFFWACNVKEIGLSTDVNEIKTQIDNLFPARVYLRSISNANERKYSCIKIAISGNVRQAPMNRSLDLQAHISLLNPALRDEELSYTATITYMQSTQDCVACQYTGLRGVPVHRTVWRASTQDCVACQYTGLCGVPVHRTVWRASTQNCVACQYTGLCGVYP